MILNDGAEDMPTDAEPAAARTTDRRIAALTQLAWDGAWAILEAGGPEAQRILDGTFPPLPKPIDVTIDYLRSGRPRDTFARASVQKAGRRVAHVHVDAWQDSRSRPIAILRGNFMMPSNAAQT